jgi:aspartate dehydrogenase
VSTAKNKPRLGVIGCGAIAQEIVRAVREGVVNANIIVMMDIYPEKCQKLAEMLTEKPSIVTSIDDFLQADIDYAIEAASQQAVREYGEKILSKGVSLVVLSVGALLDPDTRHKLEKAAEESGARIYAPTGAIAGLDAVRAARIAGIETVKLRTIKPAKSLGVNVDKPTKLYEGPAHEAVKLYPFNINVAAALSLAAGKEAQVEIIADPNATRNTHIIIVESPATRIEIKVENTPSKTNPKTSWLAALSAIELLRRITSTDPLLVGS